MTRKQRETLDILRSFHRNHGYSPSCRELAELLGITKGSAHKRLVKLQEQRVISLSGKWHGVQFLERKGNDNET